MNKLKIIILALTLVSFKKLHCQVSDCLISKGIVNANGCNIVAEPQLYPGHCIAYILPFLSRAANAEDLVSFNYPATCWGWCPPGAINYNDAIIPSGNTVVNCIKPYDRCVTNYCPDKYCDIIKSLIDIKATLIVRAVNIWTRSGEMSNNTVFYNAMKQMVIDINAAYDCNNLQRPIIQGTIFEHTDIGVQNVNIPTDVISQFIGSPGFDYGYYCNAGTQIPKNNLFFKYDNIRNLNVQSLSDCPDITRIEAKMWFYHLAKIYIDLDFKSIHMGQMANWANNDIGYSSTSLILGKIRNYASSQNSFVLLTEENRKAIKFPNTNIFMFDFDSRALRIREISSPQVSGDYNCNGNPTYNLSNTPCSNELYPGIVDECVLKNAGCMPSNIGGYSPINNCFLQKMPFVTYFDWGAGTHSPVNQPSVGETCPWTAPASTWGYDDTRWFANQIGVSCRSFWIGDVIKKVRTYKWGIYNFGYMISPNLLEVKMPEQASNYLSGINPTSGSQKYVMFDEPTVADEVKSKWLPNNNLYISIWKSCINPNGLCSILPPKLNRQNKYSFNLLNPDNTTIYTWHIQNPDGSWQPYTYGNTREFYPTISGFYTIYIRQDNLGLFPSQQWYGIKTDSYKIFLYRRCCGSQELANVNGMEYLEDYEGEIKFENNNDLSEFENYLNSDIPFYDIDEDSIDFLGKNNEILETIDKQIQEEIEIYPNPTSDVLNINIPHGYFSSGIIHLEILNIYGQKLFFDTLINSESNTSSTHAIDVSNYINQIYFIKISDNLGKSNTFKFFKK